MPRKEEGEDDDDGHRASDRVKGGEQSSLGVVQGTRTFFMVPHIEVFHLNKLLIPQVQIQIQMYFNPPTLWSMQYHGVKCLLIECRRHQS